MNKERRTDGVKVLRQLPVKPEETQRTRGWPRICDDVIEAIGCTPLIRLHDFVGGDAPSSYVKFEGMNPGGSIKDRSAREMLASLESDGTIRRGSMLIVSTSGNMGVSLALQCAKRGYKLIAVVDPKIAKSNEKILRIFGATVAKATTIDVHGGYHLSRIEMVQQLKRAHPEATVIDQYDSPANVQAHYRTTAAEMHAALSNQLSLVVAAAGTGGTLMGIARYFKEHAPHVSIWAVDEYGSLALPTNTVAAPRFLNGMGTSIRPANYDYAHFHQYVHRCWYVTAEEAITAAIQLARKEGILTGGSGGAVAHVLRNIVPPVFGPDAHVVGILPDHGSRYVDEFFSEEWLAQRSIGVPIDGPATAIEEAAGRGGRA